MVLYFIDDFVSTVLQSLFLAPSREGLYSSFPFGFRRHGKLRSVQKAVPDVDRAAKMTLEQVGLPGRQRLDISIIMEALHPN
ncbi:uncharacterized protein STEHIDRAFT_123227 [Stereum hirsutum FP-91666 SS1]|uniref:uncharacterized protein n=1 Tax=Stereum hirsutum (strain FP-91666) TaxID=721885 RepID=UPI0004449246|nr:uncharacterized protein STEHIDRAFT_123227 [Stereum hirsutum FP-91666 SS1]EIM84431.1 hypothetical protein STEHIDRAFT_123227 [Stereum hirsutum FP-91666 SS1]